MIRTIQIIIWYQVFQHSVTNSRFVERESSGLDCSSSECEAAFHPQFKPKDDHFIPKYFEEQNSEYWRSKARKFVEQQRTKEMNRNVAKNMILFLGDGMSVVTQAATRVYLGGEERELFFESFPYSAFSKTYCVDAQVPDSACTSTAYLDGVKTNKGTIGVNAKHLRYDCTATANTADHVESIGDWALAAGKEIGLVTTTRVTHASPAGLFGHIAERYWETDAKISGDGCDPDLIDDITEQLVLGETGKRLKVIFGGGRRTFLNSTLTDEEGSAGHRTDGKNLIELWKNMEGMGERTYIWNNSQLQNLKITPTTGQVMGLFAPNHCDYQLDIDDDGLQEAKPSLAEMVEKAIDILSTSPKGFFLFVEGGRIDLAHHDNRAKYALEETVQFAKVVEVAAQKLNFEDTLMVVTADHSHAVSYAGYSERGEDILGTAGVATQDGMKYMTLSYGNGMGYYTNFNTTSGRRVDPDTLRKSKQYRHPATVPLEDDTHGGDDVVIYARGPFAHLFNGVLEQNVIPHMMAYAACIGNGITACT